ncbi:MAG TPA: Fe-S protein assembly co-chaperone HscB [Cellvibrionaceae bacterium]|nr:Fe-S protein assembly co-chaperone HscB [Cellvibrionaceae bacterium]HMW71381.1 Fe-S protein assembly co-chaperone HscB [Cellvibrionaceae bacterium]HMY39600.1 Fe-S protein assembly co-chaperone HscB [Marinagarivorans sp.]HNG60458.1 Fe-S protein assembly co-chaperone HscB [Cellvibrionaceae bacterium]
MIQHNYFELFQLPQAFDLDQAALAAAYRKVQQQVHPDKFAGLPAAEQRMAVQFAALVNQAFDTLRHSVKRAQYLLELAGQGQSMQNSSTTDPEFLLQQMQWRERLADCQDEADPLAALDALRQQAKAAMAVLEGEFGAAYKACNWPEARQLLGKLMFVNKLLADIHQHEDLYL